MSGGVEGCVGGLDQVCGCVSFGLVQATPPLPVWWLAPLVEAWM
jgi:hypothetical protein